MKAAILMPQEVEVFYIIPAIRKELAVSMKAAGKKQKEIAGLLAVRESTVSQYISEKRAAGFSLNEKTRKAIEQASGRINDRTSLMTEVQKLLEIVREEREICRIHEAVSEVPKGCEVCYLRK